MATASECAAAFARAKETIIDADLSTDIAEAIREGLRLRGLCDEVPWQRFLASRQRRVSRPSLEIPGAKRYTVTWNEFMFETAPSLPSLWGNGLIVKGGGYVLLGGDTGVGKTVFISNLLIAAALGNHEFLGFGLPGRPVTSLLLEAEGNRYLFRDRIRGIADALGVKAPLPIHFHARDSELAIDSTVLEAMITETRAEIVFMDTIGRFWSGDENNATEWRRGVTSPLAKLSATHDTSFIFGDHFNKPNESRSGTHKIRGTPAKIQDCGLAMRLEIRGAGRGGRVLFFDRVKDGAVPFPDREPSRMPLKMDLAIGTVKVDEGDDALIGSSGEPRHADVRRIVGELAGSNGKVSTEALRLKIQSDLDLEKSRATDLISSTVRAKEIERAGHGYYRLPGSLLEPNP